MRKFLVLILISSFVLPCFGEESYDVSIDTEIRKKYNTEELPPLPNVTPKKTDMPKETIKKTTGAVIAPKIQYASGKTYTLKNGTKITLISQEKVSNWSYTGSKISLVSQNQIMTREGIIIPAGTVFKAHIIKSHAPQITGNGGLIKLKIDEIYFNGVMSAVDTKLLSVNSIKVINSQIKGKRRYLSNCAKAMTPGKKTYKVMKKASQELLPYPIINILSVVPFTIGSAAYLINIPIAPAVSVFMKGSSITIPAESAFFVKVSENNQIRG